MLNYIPINRAFYIYHFSVYIIVFLFERKSGKNYKFSNILQKKKKITSRSILVYKKFNYRVLFVTAVVMID